MALADDAFTTDAWHEFFIAEVGAGGPTATSGQRDRRWFADHPSSTVARVTRTIDDLLQANRASAAKAVEHGLVRPLDGRAELAIVTCMDARINPHDVFDLRVGDSVVLRNPGGQVDESMLTALALAVRVLGVRTILVMQHTKCAMASPEQVLRNALIDGGVSPESARQLDLPVLDDQQARLRHDVDLLRSAPVLAGSGVTVHGLVLDVDTGVVRRLA